MRRCNDRCADAIANDGPCAGKLFYTGEIIDWDATENVFCGVFQATVQVHGDSTRTDQTNPNGRFQLCLAPAATTQVDITPPTTTSQCVTAGLYQIPGIAIANQQVIATGKTISERMIGMDRVMPFFTGLGVTYDSTKAIVFVHVEGMAHPVASGAAHDTAIAWDGTTWAAGNSGVNVVFPNTDVTSGTTAISVTGGTAVGTGSVPVVAGTFTYVTIVGN